MGDYLVVGVHTDEEITQHKAECCADADINTVCPGSSDPFYIASLLFKMGHYFLDILYLIAYS